MSNSTPILKLVLTALLAIGLLTGNSAQAAEENNNYISLPDYPMPPKSANIDKKFISILKEHKLVGLSILAFQGEKIIFSGGYGWANLNPVRKAAPDTVFRTASISKMITATALMQLYEQGKFALDDDISDYLGYQVRNPHYPDHKITFRQLFTHTSSIEDSSMYEQIAVHAPQLFREINIKDMLLPGSLYYSPDAYSKHAPGEIFSYSNLGSCLQGSLVEAIAKIPFDEYCNKYIFSPLGMDSSFNPADIKNWQKTAGLYRPSKDFTSFTPTVDNFKGKKPERAPRTAPLGSALSASPAGGLRSSAADIGKFMMMHANKGKYKGVRILKSDTAEMMHNLEWFGYGYDGFYKQKGLNFHITDDLVPGQRFIGHSAEAYGLIGDAYFDPDTKFGFVFLINGGRYVDENPFFSVENELAKALYNEFAPKQAPKRRKISGKPNDAVITVNDRKLFLPVPAAELESKNNGKKIIFIPETAAAEALKALIEKDEKTGVLIFSKGTNKVELFPDRIEIIANDKITQLPVAPYFSGGHLMVPLREIANALKINADINF